MMKSLSPRRLLLIAYSLQDYQLAGGPGWIASDSYDIQAKADDNASVQQMEGPMLQVLLEERFKLSVHRETRQLSIYKLETEKNGARLTSTQSGSCIPYITDSSPSKANPGEPVPNFCGLHATTDGSNRSLDGKGVSMATLAETLSRTYTAMLGRNVIDGTGLTGTFDIHLTWAKDSLGAGDSASLNLTGPSIFTGLQEQLGLRLESTKGPVEVLVIDHAERPTQN